MNKLGRWLATAPMPLYFLVVGLAFGLVTSALNLALGAPADAFWLQVAISGVTFGVLMTAIRAWRRRQSRTPDR